MAKAFRAPILIGALMLLAMGGAARAAPAMPLPKFTVGLDTAKGPQDVSLSLQILLILTVLSLAPAIVTMLTSFARIVIVLSFTRSAIGAQQIPPNSVLVGLALFLTFFTMAPVWKDVNTQALQPYLSHQLSYQVAAERAVKPVRGFMLRQTREADLSLFVSLSHLPRPHTEADVPTYVLIPAFIIGELKTAFTMGFIVFIPFLIIDMVVAVTLMSMGMMMVPPVLISLPFKILLFVMVNGWHLIAQALVTSFH